MIGARVAVNIMAEMPDGPHDSKSLQLRYAIVLFMWLQCSTGIGNGASFSIFLFMRKYHPQSCTRSIHLEQKVVTKAKICKHRGFSAVAGLCGCTHLSTKMGPPCG